MFWNNPNLSKVAFSFERFKLRANFSGTQPFKDQKSLRKVLHYFGMNLSLSKTKKAFERSCLVLGRTPIFQRLCLPLKGLNSGRTFPDPNLSKTKKAFERFCIILGRISTFKRFWNQLYSLP